MNSVKFALIVLLAVPIIIGLNVLEFALCLYEKVERLLRRYAMRKDERATGENSSFPKASETVATHGYSFRSRKVGNTKRPGR